MIVSKNLPIEVNGNWYSKYNFGKVANKSKYYVDIKFISKTYKKHSFSVDTYEKINSLIKHYYKNKSVSLGLMKNLQEYYIDKDMNINVGYFCKKHNEDTFMIELREKR